MTTPVLQRHTEIDYPDSDGKPMAESDFQLRPILYAVAVLRHHFRDRPDVYVSGNILLYYEEGRPDAVISPDVMVVFGAPKHDRSSYLLWREPKAPDWVLEVTSKSTRFEDQGPKRGIYAFIGVQEYFQYDPTGDYLKPPLQGFELREGNYWPLAATQRPDGTLVIRSAILGLDVQVEAGRLAFHAPASGDRLLSYDEAQQARQEAEEGRRKAEQARLEAEQGRREAERARLEAEQARAAAEARAAVLEAQLRALLAQQPPPDDPAEQEPP
jgi:Uma2 family endonuclease